MTFIAYYIVALILLQTFFKADKSMLYCGIAGFSGVKKLTPEQELKVTNNMKLLAAFNESRGGDGCGLFMNNKIFKGYKQNSKVDHSSVYDFLGNEDYQFPLYNSKETTSIIFHARKATHGVKSEENCHPFYVESDKGAEENLILVHNGQIKNIWGLLPQYGFKLKDFDVDSHALAALLANNDPKEILEAYQGWAALMWIKPSEPNTLYVYHGASKETKNGVRFEERPMYFLSTKEGTYFSSMANSLMAIRDNLKQEVQNLKYNHVLRWINGKFDAGFDIKIDRDEANVTTYNYYSGGGTTVTYPNSTHQTQIGFPVSNSKTATIESLVYKETEPYESTQEGRIYFHMSRYWLNKGSNSDELLHGKHFINSKGIKLEAPNNDSNTLYFWNGVLLKGEEAFVRISALKQDPKSWVNDKRVNFAYNISSYAMQAVTNLADDFTENIPSWKYAWFFGGQKANKNLSPKFSSRTYEINTSGVLLNIIPSRPEDKVTILGKEPKKIKSVYDTVFNSMQEIKQALSLNQDMAVEEFIRETLTALNGTEPLPAELHMEQHECYKRVIAEGITIREALGDVTSLLETFEELIKSNKAFSNFMRGE